MRNVQYEPVIPEWYSLLRIPPFFILQTKFT